MIISLFEWLSNALYGNLFFALSSAFVWGVLSIVLSPCHLASLPLIIGFIDEQGKISTKRAFVLSFLFAFGILVTIAFIGVITSVCGRMLGDVGPLMNYFLAVIFFVVGLHLLGFISLSWSGGKKSFEKRGFVSSFLLGLIFGVALGPCSFAYMAPILGITFSLSSSKMLYGILLLFVYGVGHCSVIVFAGTFTEVIQRYLNWNKKSHGSVILKKICGVLVILGGVYLVFISRR
ncbi:cytochrome C biogenesis protein [bacterium]|nr:cytochrome C biogenesis protein [bacterium]